MRFTGSNWLKDGPRCMSKGDGLLRCMSKGASISLQIRTLMVVVAVAAVLLGLIAHIESLIRDENDFALPILIAESISAAVLLAITGIIGCAVRLIRRDDAYASLLRQKEFPEQCPFMFDDVTDPMGYLVTYKNSATAEKRGDSCSVENP